jgi:hypothetical protein
MEGRIQRMSKKSMIALGIQNDSKYEMTNNTMKLFNELRPKTIKEFKRLADKLVPKLIKVPEEKMIIKEIKKTLNVTKKNKSELIRDYKNGIQEKNFNEILRIADLNEGLLTYNNNGIPTIYRVTGQNRNDLRDVLFNNYEFVDMGSSDEQLLEMILNNPTDIRGYNIDQNLFLEDNHGGFIAYKHTLPFDLSYLGIFGHGINSTPKDYHKNHCLYHSLKILGLSAEKLIKLKTISYTRDIPICKLKDIAEILNICITLQHKEKLTNYGSERIEKFHIAVIKNHFIPVIKTDISYFCLTNWNLVKDLKNPKNIKRIAGTKICRENIFVNSVELLNLVLKHHSIPLNKTDCANNVFYNKIKLDDFPDLNYCAKYCTKLPAEQIESDCYSMKTKSSDMRSVHEKEFDYGSVLRIFFDFETVVNSENVHLPREVCCILVDNNIEYKKHWLGYDCGLHFIEFVKTFLKNYDEIHLIAHNASFDFNFVIKYLNSLEICKLNNRFIYAKSTIKNKKIIIKDSYNFIATSLKDFSNMFNLNVCKEDFDHNWIKYDNFDSKGYLINKFMCINGTSVNLEELSAHYCLMDCEVLQKGYNIFSDWCKLLELNIDRVYTLSSLAMRYAQNNGCFDGVIRLGGVPQFFINKCMYGGKVMTRKNEKMIELEKGQTLDANSLYPSAMLQFDGFLKGVPKVITNLSMDFLNSVDYYFIEIKITKVGKFLDMPLLCLKSKLRVDYINEMIGQKMYVGKVYLEDLIKYQEIEFEIIRGYYFDEGYNLSLIHI